MRKLLTPRGATSGVLLLSFAFIALLAYGSETPEKEKPEVFRDNKYNGWVVPFIQASPSDLSLSDDLFDFRVTKTDGNLRMAQVTLRPKKTEYHDNPNKNSGVVAWPITKFTRYHDLNGDGEFDLILKSIPNKEKPTGPNDIREFIIMDDSFIEIKHSRIKPGFQKEFTSLKGERFVMSPEGWVKK